jgi:hypothetical protein
MKMSKVLFQAFVVKGGFLKRKKKVLPSKDFPTSF